MAISAPSSLEGSSLTSMQRERLQGILDSIEKVNPTRSKDSIVVQAVASFKKTARILRGRWVDRDMFYLNNGDGPVVIPSWSPLANGQ
tara:strand:+ start:78 stop:341 length:264 start_codon:yes stop_codon:yes gene_type:complete